MSLIQLRGMQRSHDKSTNEAALPAPPIELERIRQVSLRRPELATTSLQQAGRSLNTGAQNSLQAAQHNTTITSHSILDPVEAPAQPIQSTVEIKPHGNILTRLFAIATTSLNKLTVTEVDEFEDEEAELKYQKFTDFLRTASNDLSSPENDPLVYFRGHWIEHDQVLLQPPDPDAIPLPYIRFIGARDENEVRILHASLSKRKFRKEYYPLRICYVVQQLNPLASDDDKVVLLRSNLNTLCGALATIGTGRDCRIVTIGGIVEGIGAYYALTTSHHSRADPSLSAEEFLSSLDINEDDYDNDVGLPLIVDMNAGSAGLDRPSSDNDHDDSNITPGRPTKPPPLGTVQCTGSDWALLKLDDPQFALPNLIDKSNIAGGSKDDEPSVGPVFLTAVTSEPKAGFMRMIAGASGVETILLSSTPANLRHPSGAWIRTWKAKLGPTSDSKLKRGDSGAWVVDTNSGDVYGHVMAATDNHAYIQPLVEIFKDIQSKQNIDLKLASPFGQLAELAKLHYLRGNQSLADQYARRALDPAVLSRSSEAPLTSAIMNRIQQSYVGDIDLVVQVLMRTGRSIGLGLSELRDDAREGRLGDSNRVLALLTDLSEVSSVALSPDVSKSKQKQVSELLSPDSVRSPLLSSRGIGRFKRFKEEYQYSDLWLCCNCCQMGGMSVWATADCPSCAHLRCETCPVERIELPPHR